MIDIKGFENYLYEEELSANTIDCYLTALRKYSGKYSEITKPNLIEYKKYLMDNFKPKSVNNRITALLADILGHGSVEMTQIYLRQSEEQQKDAVDKAVNW